MSPTEVLAQKPRTSNRSIFTVSSLCLESATVRLHLAVSARRRNGNADSMSMTAISFAVVVSGMSRSDVNASLSPHSALSLRVLKILS
jgi:hypothetical protein